MRIAFINEYLNRVRKIRRGVKELRSVPRLTCRAETLMPAGRVDTNGIFGSEEIGSEWRALRPELEALQIAEGVGGVNPGDARAIFYLTRYFRPRSVLDVGTNVGVSMLHMAAALQVAQRPDEKERLKLVTVDVRDMNDPIAKPWLQRRVKYSPAESVKRIGCGGLVAFIKDSFLDYAAGCNQKFDFIFLDGDHAAQTVYREIPAALGLLEDNGLLLLHDYFPRLKPLWSNGSVIPGPFLAAERLVAEGAGFKAVPLGRLPWPTKLGSNVTSLALLVKSTGARL